MHNNVHSLVRMGSDRLIAKLKLTRTIFFMRNIGLCGEKVVEEDDDDND